MIGEVGLGYQTAMKFLNAGRAFIGALCVGIADHLLRISVEQAKRRQAFGRPIGQNQAIQWMLDRVADRAVPVFGGMGVLTEGPVERTYRFVRMLRVVEGTSEIQRLVIARNLGL